MTRPLDFRSDTATRPTPGMREAMARAEVGDDVSGEDPTINRLQERLAEMLGKEAALFVPSGTMSNQIGVRVHCQLGDEIICESSCHIYAYEQGGFAQLSGVSAKPVDGQHGVIDVEQLKELIHPDNCHYTRTRLVCLENTHNRGGGRVLPYDGVVEICAWAHSHGLATHLDGARLFNAVVASGIDARTWAQHFDTVSVCFSKGLGAPVGSALAGPADVVREGLRVRKVFGGGMRQAGVIAAGALYALENNIERMAEDHANAQILGDAVRSIDGLELVPDAVETNLVFFRVSPRLGTAAEFAGKLKQHGLSVGSTALRTIRMVTHLDVSRDDTLEACNILRTVAGSDDGAPVAAARSAYA